MDNKFKVGDLIEYSYSKINTLYKHYIGAIYEIEKFENNILSYYISQIRRNCLGWLFCNKKLYL